jgi:fucose 4-O-acetylase-like acetyltransferase
VDPRLITPYLIAALIVWGLYRRMRRSFGRQRVRDRLMWVRIAFLVLVTALIVAMIARDVDVLAALMAGIACGALLGYLGLRHTKFEVAPEGRFYTPHTYIGLAVTALFVGRLLYRFLGIYNGVIPAATAGQGLASAYQRSPFTLAVFGALVGYYVLYYLGILQRTRSPASLAGKADAAPLP